MSKSKQTLPEVVKSSSEVKGENHTPEMVPASVLASESHIEGSSSMSSLAILTEKKKKYIYIVNKAKSKQTVNRRHRQKRENPPEEFLPFKN